MKLLRRYIRETLIRSVGGRGLVTEITKLPQEYFSAIDQAITGSRFWEEDNHHADADVISNDDDSGSLQTPAATKLQDALTDVFDKLNLDIDVFVSTRALESDDDDYSVLHYKHPAYPSRWIYDASWYVSKQRPGRNTVDLEIMSFNDDADPSDVDPPALVRHIAQTIRHELVHYSQMKKQAKSHGLDDIATFEKMLNDPNQVPKRSNNPNWEKDYLEAHIEIDAHAHDAAEDMLAVYGKQKALDILRTNPDLGDADLPNAVRHYFEKLESDNKALRNFRIKLYQHIQHMSGDVS